MPATDSYWRDIKKMHAVFAGSAVALFLATIWMMAADHSDEWRKTQHTGDKIRAALIDRQINSIESDPDFEQRLAAAKANKEKADQELDAQRADLDKRQKELKSAETRLGILSTALKNAGADRDVAKANQGLRVRDEASDKVLDEYHAKYSSAQEVVDNLRHEFDQQNESVKKLRGELAAKTHDRDEAAAELAKVQAQVTQLETTKAKVEPSGFSKFKRKLMDLPILDGFNSPTAIKQDWLPNLRIKLGMASTARFDRCRTCHLNIDTVDAGPKPTFPFGHSDSHDYMDWVNSGKYPHPFSTHPNVDLYLTSTSPHSLEKFGCTICHDGQGSGTSFSNASHTPNDPVIDEEWHEEHHYASNHFWEYPMQPERLLESTCLKCHHTVVELAVNPKFGNSAPKVTEGWHLIQKYGCFGCHEINGYDAGKPIGPDMRLEPQTAEEAKRIADDPFQIAGQMRKVGPSLRHIASKTTQGFVETWTDMPKRFRPTTKMPQFYHLSNQEDELARRYTPIELAGISEYLFGKSEPIKLLAPEDGYTPDISRGKLLFSQRGCLACHTHSDFPAAKSDFAPNLDRVHDKIPLDEKAEIGEVDGKKPKFSRWLYTWIRDPERHHSRTKMPNLFLSTYEEKGNDVDPAADITAWLLEKGPEKFPTIRIAAEGEGPLAEPRALEEVLYLNLARTLTPTQAAQALGYDDEFAFKDPKNTPSHTRRYPVGEAATIKGDEIELVNTATIVDVKEGAYLVEFGTPPSDAKSLKAVWLPGSPWADRVTPVTYLRTQSDSDRWVLRFDFELPQGRVAPPLPGKGQRFYINGPFTPEMELNYVGRKTISKYGCYGCHDIPGFEAARPIGTALQDWGRKDPSRLAPEHIAEFLKHHGEPVSPANPSGSTEERVERSLKQIRSGELTGEANERERAAAFYYESLMHHGRPGFFWQKLRDPRSYDYEMLDTKGYDERLKMPKFPFSEAEIGAVATFVLGLVADPPPESYIYRPKTDVAARNEGERLLEKYNCVGCHMVEMPKFTVKTDVEGLPYFTALSPDEHPQALELFKELKPPRSVTLKPDAKGRAALSFHGSLVLPPDPDETDPESREYAFNVWETLSVNGKMLRPAARLNAVEADVVSQEPPRGGSFAEILINSLIGNSRNLDVIDSSWQKAPPPLYKEGIKVQTSWLYRFLKEPYQLRHTTVLRMPRFNMSDAEARVLANYFAAVDGAEFPYQEIPQRTPPYLDAMEDALGDDGGSGEKSYLGQSWRLLNNPKLCINCHSVGGKDVQVDPQKPQPRGPNLDYVADRLRPDWTQLWLYNPKWITPYTSMPALFPKTKAPDPDLLKNDAHLEAVGIRDALMNYPNLMERFGRIENPPAPQAGEGGE